MSLIESARDRIRDHFLAEDISILIRSGGTLVVRIKDQPSITVNADDIINQMLVSCKGIFPENFLEEFKKEVDKRAFDVLRQHAEQEVTLTFLDPKRHVIGDYVRHF